MIEGQVYFIDDAYMVDEPVNELDNPLYLEYLELDSKIRSLSSNIKFKGHYTLDGWVENEFLKTSKKRLLKISEQLENDGFWKKTNQQRIDLQVKKAKSAV